MDKRVTVYANTFGGTVFVAKEGEIVYALLGRDEGQETWVMETGYGLRVPGSVTQLKSKNLSLFLISCSDSISKLVSPNPNESEEMVAQVSSLHIVGVVSGGNS